MKINPVVLLFFLLLPPVLATAQKKPVSTDPPARPPEYTDLSRYPIVVADDYPVTDEMFSRDYKEGGNQIHKKAFYSSDMVWYKNKDLDEVLVFELHTDQCRMHTYHFRFDSVPDDLVKRLGLYFIKDDDPYKVNYPTIADKQGILPKFIKSGRNIPSGNFRSKKGISLGLQKEQVVKIWGTPDSTTMTHGIERCEWRLVADYYVSLFWYDMMERGQKISRLSDDRAQRVIMYFKNGKLEAQELNNLCCSHDPFDDRYINWQEVQ